MSPPPADSLLSGSNHGKVMEQADNPPKVTVEARAARRVVVWLLLVLAVVAAVIFAATVWLADPLVPVVFGIALLFWTGLPVTIVAAVLLVVATSTGRSRRLPLTMLSVVAVFGGLVALAIPVNRFIQERAVVAAKEYPSQAGPLLEAYRQAHGCYPASLDQVPGRPAAPRLLRYRSDGSTYTFWFPQPGGLIDTWDYHSETKTWGLST